MQTSLHRRILVSLVACFVFATTAPAGAAEEFGDVEDDRYYSEAVGWMVSEGITTGIEPGCYGPEEAVSRGQIATFLFRLDSSHGNAPEYFDHPFDDVRATYQQRPVGWLYGTGVSTGTSRTTFSPDAPISRGDFAVMLWRYAGRPAPNGDHHFTDVLRSYQHDAISWMVERGITTGTSAITFSPEVTMNRAQAATFIHRYIAPEPQGRTESTDQACSRPLRRALETVGLSSGEARCIAPFLADYDVDFLVRIANGEEGAPIDLIFAVAAALQDGCLSDRKIAGLSRRYL